MCYMCSACTVHVSHPIKYKTSNTPYFLFTYNAFGADNDIMMVIMSNTYTAHHLIICIENKIEGMSGISGS